jgi:hypothetical protein
LLLANEIIHSVAIKDDKLDNHTILLTNANEVLMKDGIHGKIARVGVGFGTGRHTAKMRGRKRENEY